MRYYRRKGCINPSSLSHTLRGIVRSVFIILLSLGLIACTGQKLSVHTDYISVEDLASYQVGTPDPLLNNPPVGQRLIVSWMLPSSYLKSEDLRLEMTIRLRDREQIEKTVTISRCMGSYVYSLLNADYFNTGGIITYKVLLIGDGQILDEWIHPLWVELINLDHPS